MQHCFGMDEWLSKVGDKIHSLRNELKDFVSESLGSVGEMRNHSETHKVFWLLQILDCVVVLTKPESPLETRSVLFTECLAENGRNRQSCAIGREMVARTFTTADRKNISRRFKGDCLPLRAFVENMIEIPDGYVECLNWNIVPREHVDSLEAVLVVKQKPVSKEIEGRSKPPRLVLMIGGDQISSYAVYGDIGEKKPLMEDTLKDQNRKLILQEHEASRRISGREMKGWKAGDKTMAEFASKNLKMIIDSFPHVEVMMRFKSRENNVVKWVKFSDTCGIARFSPEEREEIKSGLLKYLRKTHSFGSEEKNEAQQRETAAIFCCFSKIILQEERHRLLHESQTRECLYFPPNLKAHRARFRELLNNACKILKKNNNQNSECKKSESMDVPAEDLDAAGIDAAKALMTLLNSSTSQEKGKRENSDAETSLGKRLKTEQEKTAVEVLNREALLESHVDTGTFSRQVQLLLLAMGRPNKRETAFKITAENR